MPEVRKAKVQVHTSRLACRDVAAFTLLKASGAVVWAAADVLNVLYAAMPSMQTLGKEQLTLGFIFACVGIGCFMGQVIFNWIIAPECDPRPACVASSVVLLLASRCSTWLYHLLIASSTRVFPCNMWI